MLVHAPRHIMTPTATDILLLERPVPDLGVAVKRQAEEESDKELQRERPRPKRNRYIYGESKEGGEGETMAILKLMFFELFPFR